MSDEVEQEPTDLLNRNPRKVTVSFVNSRVIAAEKRITLLAKRLGQIEPQKVEALLAGLEDRAANLSRRFEALIVRDCVWTEVTRSCSGEQRLKVMSGILDAAGEDDEWWVSRDDLSIAEWRHLLLQRASRPELTEAAK
ncbi:MAG: hypothetical protein RLZZ460_118 [Chloroflexota bacterium]|jgi:hypothetical protein